MGANGSEETVMVAVHGAWSSAWAWKKMRPRLAARGVTLVTPSHTGLGERAHLARPEVDLETHIADVANVFEYEDLRDVVLVAHSYGGMVATGVLWRLPERTRSIVYLDAMVPEPGTSAADVAWITPRRGVQPFSTFTQPLKVEGPAPRLARTYVYCQRSGPGDVFRPFADRARRSADRSLEEIDASHSPHITAPDLFTEVLLRAC